MSPNAIPRTTSGKVRRGEVANRLQTNALEDRWGVENLKDLSKVPQAGATIVVGAPKFKGGTGGPARVFALV